MMQTDCLLKSRKTMNFNLLAPLSLLVTIAFLLTGCNQYEVSKDSQGRTIRLNKSTGEVAVLEGDKLIVANPEEKIRADVEAGADAVELSNRSQRPISKGKDGTSTILYSNNALQYKVVFRAIPRGYTGADGQYFVVRLLNNGSQVFENRANVRRVFDNNGHPTTKELSGTINMSEEDYKNIDDLSITARGL